MKQIISRQQLRLLGDQWTDKLVMKIISSLKIPLSMVGLQVIFILSNISSQLTIRKMSTKRPQSEI